MGASAVWLPDGKRLHYQHGPIDLIVEASGAQSVDLDVTYRAAWERFQTVLEELVEELPRLQTFCPPDGLGSKGQGRPPHGTGKSTPCPIRHNADGGGGGGGC